MLQSTIYEVEINEIIQNIQHFVNQSKKSVPVSVCPYCHIEPASHSFQLIKQIPQRQEPRQEPIQEPQYQSHYYIYYTKPSSATMYNDNQGIMSHYRNELERTNVKHTANRWIWILDADEFSLKHATNLSLVKKLSTLITNEYGENLTAIYVLNTNTFMWMMWSSVSFFLDETLTRKIHFLK